MAISGYTQVASSVKKMKKNYVNRDAQQIDGQVKVHHGWRK